MISGLIAIVALLGLALALPWGWFIPLFKNINEVTFKLYRDYKLGLRYDDFLNLGVIAVFTGIFTIPELLIAVIAGLWVRSNSRRNALRVSEKPL